MKMTTGYRIGFRFFAIHNLGKAILLVPGVFFGLKRAASHLLK